MEYPLPSIVLTMGEDDIYFLDALQVLVSEGYLIQEDADALYWLSTKEQVKKWNACLKRLKYPLL